MSSWLTSTFTILVLAGIVGLVFLASKTNWSVLAKMVREAQKERSRKKASIAQPIQVVPIEETADKYELPDELLEEIPLSKGGRREQEKRQRLAEKAFSAQKLPSNNGLVKKALIPILILAVIVLGVLQNYDTLFSKNEEETPAIQVAKNPEADIAPKVKQYTRRSDAVPPWITICQFGEGNPLVLEEIQKEFPTDTTMWNIAAAVSSCKPIDPSSSRSPLVVGVFRIDMSKHRIDCGQPGIDVTTFQGNIACAKLLRDRRIARGEDPYGDWNESRDVWGPFAPGSIIIDSIPISSTDNAPSNWRIFYI